tara:strand:- start:1313 stop:1495 length:183 start_codon:yes stop_codon:yes gene_type:complete
MQVRTELFTDDIGEKCRFMHFTDNKLGKTSLKFLGASFTNSGVVSDSIISDLTSDEQECI